MVVVVRSNAERNHTKVYRCNHCMDGEGLRYLRRIKGRTAEETAAFFGISESELMKIENRELDFFAVAQKRKKNAQQRPGNLH